MVDYNAKLILIISGIHSSTVFIPVLKLGVDARERWVQEEKARCTAEFTKNAVVKAKAIYDKNDRDRLFEQKRREQSGGT